MQIGTARPPQGSQQRHGTHIATNETALLLVPKGYHHGINRDFTIYAQFDRLDHAKSHGWWAHDVSEFKIDLAVPSDVEDTTVFAPKHVKRRVVKSVGQFVDHLVELNDDRKDKP